MRILLENFRKYSLLAEEEFLVEGRIDDTKTRYPGLAKKREELDGESLLDVLIDADPSGNQKYLMNAARILQSTIENAEQQQGYEPFYGKEWPEDAGDNIYSPWGQAKNIAVLLPKFHSLQSFIRDDDVKFKDMGNIKTYANLHGVVTGAENVKTAKAAAKEKEAAYRKDAHDNSEVIDDNDHQLVIRPLSAEASCYFGKSTKWCISATRSQNYFDNYTSDGKSFYFLLAKRKDVESTWKKIAMVVDRDGTIDEYYDSEDDSMSHRNFRDAIRQIMIGAKVSDEMASMEESEPFDKEIILDGLKEWKGINDFDFDPEDEDNIRGLVGMFGDFIVEDYISGLHSMAADNTRDNPAGTPEEDYEEALISTQGAWNHIDVTLSFPSETGAENPYWESNLYLDVEGFVLNTAASQGYQLVPAAMEGEMEDELYRAVDIALNEVNIWPEEIDQDKWGSSPGTEFRIRVQDGGGSLESFEQFLVEQSEYDRDFTADFHDHLITQLEDEGVIIHPEKEEAKKEAERQQTKDAEYWPDPEEKKKQLELPLQEHRICLKIVKSR